MSYIELKKGFPNHKKAVISFWFRIPKKSLEDAADKFWAEELKREASGNPYYTLPRLHEIVPLMTFGPETLEGYHLKPTPVEYNNTRSGVSWSGPPPDCSWGPVVAAPESETHTSHSTWNKVSKRLVNPSFIGIKSIWGDDDKLESTLYIRLLSDDTGSGKSVNLTEVSKYSDYITCNSSFDSECPAPGVWAWDYGVGSCMFGCLYPGGERVNNHTYIDQTELFAKQRGPEAFEISTDLEITPDVWHHLLISYDLDHNMMKGEGTKVSETIPGCLEGQTERPIPIITENIKRKVIDPCKMWIALDLKNYVLDQSQNGYIGGLKNNNIAAANVVQGALAVYATLTDAVGSWGSPSRTLDKWISDDSLPIPSYSYSPDPLPTNKYPLGIPASKKLVDCIYRVEMAELQIYTGIAIDTSKPANVAAFITDKGKPEKMKKAEELLDRKPVVKLHLSGNWIKGNNTGTVGKDPDTGKKIPEGQFTPGKGKIRRWKPDPNLLGDQGES